MNQRSVILVLILSSFLISGCTKTAKSSNFDFENAFKLIESHREAEEVKYGKEVFDETARYIGPNGSVAKVTGNLLSCKNCHLDSGTRKYALHLTESHGSYPQFRSRENLILTMADRINSCISYPMLAQHPLDVNSREMQALLLYIRFINATSKVNLKHEDNRLRDISYPQRAASPTMGRKLFAQHCARCHGERGEGQLNANKDGFLYPALWGENGHGIGSSMHRNIIFARFIKSNMPFGEATPDRPVLTDEESLDIAAFVNSENINPRRKAKGNHIFAALELKPLDYPEGPYADPYTPDQHRYGPYGPIVDYYKSDRRAKGDFTDGDKTAP
jgi:thiosulfate dehydrogenase